MTKTKLTLLAGIASICLATSPVQAADVWQFTVIQSQSGLGENCGAVVYIPCSVSNDKVPYTLGTVSIENGSTIVDYIIEDPSGVIVAVDDNHLVAFAPTSSTGLGILNWPPPTTNPPLPLLVNIGLNVIKNQLNGIVYLDLDSRGSAQLSMQCMDNLCIGYWVTWEKPVHQFVARADKVSSPMASR